MQELLHAFVFERVVGHRGEVFWRAVGGLLPGLLLLPCPLLCGTVLAPEDLRPRLLGLALARRPAGGGRSGQFAVAVDVLVDDLEGYGVLANWAVDQVCGLGD